ncbi:phosphoglucomutase/phosphomannomutase PgmG [Zavarzinia sp. CC-PAN008]|uniref:phosphoglucomutase/phosphomannomutase PgmG n=1 Tax=Zavarzinia sp. CC-PAN008 TaxID=3243332 RepID=UPI003F743538
MSAAHAFHPTSLREYDIRGTVGKTLGTEDARAIGRAFATILRRHGKDRPKVTVGYDGRVSSPELEAALVDGLVSCGAEVERIGRGPTPMLYFSVYHREADGGIMVTGSHNPPDQNGFKMMLGRKAFFGEQIQEIGRIAAVADYAWGQGAERAISVFDAYVDRLAEEVIPGDLAVGWDPGNGAGGEVVEALVKRLPGRHYIINGRIDGTFPAHHPDPTVPENLVQLQELVLAKQLDIGIGLDGDADRVGAIDAQGRIIWGDQMIALFSRDVLRDHPGATIIGDVKASQVLYDEIARLGGVPLMFKTGHSLIKTKMAEVGSPLAGEMSGHIFFNDRWYGFDDAIYGALRLLVTVANHGPLADLRDSLPERVNTPELRIECPDERKFAVIDEVRQRLADAGAEVNGIDGVRVNTPDGWWLLRASNTQAVLVARAESADEAGLERLKASIHDALDQSGVPFVLGGH